MATSKRAAFKLIADFEYAVREHVSAGHRDANERNKAQGRLDFEHTRLLSVLTGVI